TPRRPPTTRRAVPHTRPIRGEPDVRAAAGRGAWTSADDTSGTGTDARTVSPRPRHTLAPRMRTRRGGTESTTPPTTTGTNGRAEEGRGTPVAGPAPRDRAADGGRAVPRARVSAWRARRRRAGGPRSWSGPTGVRSPRRRARRSAAAR